MSDDLSDLNLAPPLDDPALAARIAALSPARRDWLAQAAGWGRDAAGRLAPDAQMAGFAPRLWQAFLDELFARADQPAEALRARRTQLALRADSRLRAGAEIAPNAFTQNIKNYPQSDGFTGFFELEVLNIAHPLYGGGMTPPLRREVLVSGDACVVLPYDPARDRVLLIAQFRPGVYLRGDADPWLIETVAGRLDPGETPEDTARREALEEAGIALGPLVALPPHYPSPAALTEYVYGFIGGADLSDPVAARLSAQRGGLAEEGEDIRVLIVDLAEAQAMLADGRIRNGPLIMALLWLAANRHAIGTTLGVETAARAP